MKIGVDDYDTSVEESERWAGGVAERKRRGWSGVPVRYAVREFAAPPEPADGELYVYPYSERDEMGRRRFFLYWHGYRHGVPASEGGSGWGLRGQVFNADDRPRIRENLDAGHRVFWWPTGEEISPDELRAGTS